MENKQLINLSIILIIASLIFAFASMFIPWLFFGTSLVLIISTILSIIALIKSERGNNLAEIIIMLFSVLLLALMIFSIFTAVGPRHRPSSGFSCNVNGGICQTVQSCENGRIADAVCSNKDQICCKIINSENPNETPINQNIIQTQGYSCDQLSRKLDTTTVSVPECQTMRDTNTHRTNMVGGTLLSIDKTYMESYQHYWYTLTFQGYTAPRKMFVIARTEAEFDNRILQIGKFYVFDMTGICTYITSAANSGAFDGEFTEKTC